ncbi:MAG: hypothetical protein ACI93R_002368 [Flavobacteriales bacterium]|jgi:hypothetical protein
MRIKTLLILVSVVFLASCASMSKDECLAANWEQIGLEDGSRGRVLELISQHRKACAKAGVTPNLADYERGHERGLDRYCIYEKGLSLGRNGGNYGGTCRGKNENAFLDGYDFGRDQFKALQRVRHLEKSVTEYELEIDYAQTHILELEDLIASDGTTGLERREFLIEMRELEASIPNIEFQFAQELKALKRAQDDYSALMAEE